MRALLVQSLLIGMLIAALVTMIVLPGSSGCARRLLIACAIAMVGTGIGLVGAVGCAATHLEHVRGDPRFCSNTTANVWGAGGLVAAVAWIVLLVAGLTMRVAPLLRSARHRRARRLDVEQTPDLFGGDRHRDVADAEVAEGVDHGVDDGRGGPDGSRLAETLGSQRV